MSGGFFHTIFYQPIYNLAVFLIGVLPNHSVALAVIATTLLVKFALFPLTKKALITQMRMRDIEPKLEAIRTKYKDDRQATALATMQVYKEEGVNPFSSIMALFVQLPVIFALYFIFYKGGFPSIHLQDLYSFITPPQGISMEFLMFHMAEKSWVLALIAGGAQFVQAQLAMPPLPESKEASFKNDMARSMNIQMKYVFPLIIIFISHSLSSVVALYFCVSNLFTIGQELALRKHKKTK
jgi:YidC/Oxa1 family membrane protein insertase